jgi:hypothetical protein
MGAAACREDVALGLALVGLGLAACGWKVRATLAVGIGALAWFVVVKLWWMPHFGPPTFVGYYRGLIPAGEDGFGAVARTLLSNPVHVLFTLLTRDKLILGLQLLVPLAFLPVRGGAPLLVLLLPGMAVVGLSTDRVPVVQIGFQYVSHFIPYLFLASAAALATRPHRQRLPALAALVLGTAAMTAQFGAFLHQPFRAGFQQVTFGWSAQEAKALADVRAVTALIPESASVVAGEHVGAYVARRHILMSLRDGTQKADYVLVDRDDLAPPARATAVAALTGRQYGVVVRQGRFLLLGRGRTTDDNAETARWLKRP